MSNLLKRTIFGTLFVAVIVVSLTVLPQLFPFCALVALYFMMSEFYNMSMGESYPLCRRLAILSAACLFAVMYCVGAYGLGLKYLTVAFLPILVLMVAELFEKDRSELAKFAYLFTGILYIGVPVALMPLLLFRGDSFDGGLVLSVFIMIWCSDVGAYCFGSLLGQKEGAKKLAPAISPKKSVVGVVGGAIVSVAAAALLSLCGLMDLNLIHSLVLGVLVCAAGVCGDLFESVWKRFFGVKDSGNAIPGHGGFLDRLDSSLFAFPITVIYLTLFNLL